MSVPGTALCGLLMLLHVQGASALIAVGSLDTPGTVHDVEVAGSIAYLSEWPDPNDPNSRSQLRIIDISDSTAPVELEALETPGWGYDVEVIGNLAYLADGLAGGLRVVDVSNPILPFEIGSLDTPGSARDVEVVGSLAYVVDFWPGSPDPNGPLGSLYVVDVLDPNRPVEIGSMELTGYPRDVEVDGTLAYVALFGVGGSLRVIDVSIPTAPVEIGHAVETTSTAWDVEIVGHLAYVAAGDNGLRVIDVSTPTAPFEIGAFETAGAARDVEVVGNLAYVAVMWHSLPDPNGPRGAVYVIDVSDPTAPLELGIVETPGDATDVAVAGNRAYVAEGRIAQGPGEPIAPGALRVVHLDPDEDQLIAGLDNCPFAFNPTQLDSGGIDTDVADGIGDACQCGDVDNSGLVQINDATIIKRAILGLGPVLADPLKCNVFGSTNPADDCQINDATVVKRAILGLGPGIQQVCAPAVGP